jgi:hypothetical protein
MAPSKGEWPAHFPPNCPDNTANPTQSAVFRFVEECPEDWVSWLELGRGAGSDCRRAALSCFISLQAAEDVRRVSPIHASKKIAKSDLTPAHRKIKQTGKDPEHHSLWLRTQYHAVCQTLFQIVS